MMINPILRKKLMKLKMIIKPALREVQAKMHLLPVGLKRVRISMVSSNGLRTYQMILV
jgi:hypothetical protein